MKTINYNGIQEEISNNILYLQSGDLDCYDFIHSLATDFINSVFPEAMDIEGENPYTDLLFAMLEINGIDLY